MVNEHNDTLQALYASMAPSDTPLRAEEHKALNLYLRDNSDLGRLLVESECPPKPLPAEAGQPLQQLEYGPEGHSDPRPDFVPPPEDLADCSPRDKPWDYHRAAADKIARMYSGSLEFQRLSERVWQCSQLLGFAWAPDRADPAAFTLKLRQARFCRVRHCPVCQWRRSLMWVARFYKSIPSLRQNYPQARFLFLTLTQRNMPISDLRATLRSINKGWARLSERKAFDEAVLGWIRSIEVTRAGKEMAHPHSHVLLMVDPHYFNTHYVNQKKWVQMWRQSLRIDYDPGAHIRVVRSLGTSPVDDSEHRIMAGVRETLKYAVKPEDMIGDVNWFLELTRQLHKLRFISSGGILKDVLRPDDETEEDLLLAGESEESGERISMLFGWNMPVKRYKRQQAVSDRWM